MILSFYRRVLSFSAPFLLALIWLRTKRGLEEETHRNERKGLATLPRPEGPLLWVHAASVGEMLSIQPLLTRVLEKNPEYTCLVTTVTVTAARLVRRMQNPRLIHQYAPFDHPLWVQRFMDHWKPNAVIWLESELWPNTLLAVHEAHVPLVMVNGRISDRSAKRWGYAKNAIAQILGYFDMCLAQTTQDGARLTALGAKNVHVAGNMKYASAPLPYDEQALEKLKQQIGSRLVLLFSSTHEGEEQIAANAHDRFVKTYPDLLTIIVPRHPARMSDIADICQRDGLATAIRSKAQDITPQTQIYIGDTMGEMGLFYRLSTITFIGNSLTRKPGGGHNPIEPAQLGCCIIYGSHMWNFPEIDNDLRKAKGAILVRQENDFIYALEKLLANPATRTKLKNAAQTFALNQNSVLDKVVTHLAVVFKQAGIQL